MFNNTIGGSIMTENKGGDQVVGNMCHEAYPDYIFDFEKHIKHQI